jgi:pyruvate ferredoxin oxidoreductase gamma subunit
MGEGLMFQIVIHGRGGQGVVTASEMLARTGFGGGFEVQAIPSFGSERTGAPVVGYTRLSRERILTREPILAPDAVIVLDPTLLRAIAMPYHRSCVYKYLRPSAKSLK